MFFGSRQGFKQISPADAAKRDDFVIVDVRESHELVSELGHIEGSLHVPMGTLLANGLPPEVGQDQQVLVVCRSGGRSARCAQALSNRGFAHVYNLDGGMMAWGATPLPVVGAGS